MMHVWRTQKLYEQRLTCHPRARLRQAGRAGEGSHHQQLHCLVCNLRDLVRAGRANVQNQHNVLGTQSATDTTG